MAHEHVDHESGYYELVTEPEAMRRTSLGRRHFRRARATGELAVFAVGSWPRYRWGDVLAWIERSRVDIDADVVGHDARDRVRQEEAAHETRT